MFELVAKLPSIFENMKKDRGMNIFGGYVQKKQRFFHNIGLGLCAASCAYIWPIESVTARASDTATLIHPSEHKRIPDFVDLVRQVRPAVVSITSMVRPQALGDDGSNAGSGDGFSFPFPFPIPILPQQSKQLVEAHASGFLISSDGYIVTNNHVVKGAAKVTVTLDDGTNLQAHIVGRDSKTDIALIKVTPSQSLPFIELGNSDNVQPGEWVVAVGSPFGLGGTVTAGIVSARGRDINEGPYDNFIQVDAPINRGNSGGPLFTQNGKVIGVNTAILSPSGGGSIGIGFAIPSDTVQNVVDQLRRTGHVVRGYIGVGAQMVSPIMAKALKLPQTNPVGTPPGGALIASINPDSPAQKAGLKVEDVITDVNGHHIASPHDLAVYVASLAPDAHVPVSYVRAGKVSRTNIVIGNLSHKNSPTSSASVGKRLGVSFAAITPATRQQFGLSSNARGVIVTDVEAGSIAEQGGIKPGDIVQSIDNKNISNPHNAVAIIKSCIADHRPVLFYILRDEQRFLIAVSPDMDSSIEDSNSDNSDDDD